VEVEFGLDSSPDIETSPCNLELVEIAEVVPDPELPFSPIPTYS
jgi:hypothetical protein